MLGLSGKSAKIISLLTIMTILFGVIFCFPAHATDQIEEDEAPASKSDVELAETGAVANMFLNKSALTLDINQEYKLIAFDAGTNASISTMKFTSSNTAVVKVVAATGVITALKSGTANITALDTKTNRKAVCKVTVSAKTYQPPAAPAPTSAPTAAPAPTATTLSLSPSSATVYKGCYYQLFGSSNGTITYTSSNKNVATVSSVGIVYGVGTGSAVITAKASNKTATCYITVISGGYVHISNTTASMPAGKTLLLRTKSSGVSWSSSNTAVATVSDGWVVAKKAGRAVISVSNGSGRATCLVNVYAAAPIRFAYCSPNCAVKGQKVSFIAITDQKRTGVCFRVYKKDGTYNTLHATSKVADSSRYVWTAYGKFSIAGTYKVVAYSKINNGAWTTCGDGNTSAFVANSTNKTTTVCTERRASDEVISLIAVFEGFLSKIYDDPWTGDPTIGYGRVIFTGQQFYNNLTKREAFAYLVQTVNNDGYATKMNEFLIGNKVKFNQQQFDALVCLVYNTGTGVVTGDAEVRSALLNCSDGSGSSVSYYVNGSDVRLRKGAGTNTTILREMAYGTVLTILKKTSSSWWKVKLTDGTIGYVSTDYISSRSTSGNLDLRYVNRQNLINKICQYHHAGGECVWGLLYRRVDEMEMFFYGDYDPCYGDYKYSISFRCAKNSSFHT